MNRTIEKRITKLELYADRAAIMPPPELISYMRGKKIEEEKIEEEKIKFHQIFDEWMVRMKRLSDRGTKIDAALLQEMLNAMPEPTRTKVRKRLIELYNARKSKE